ncbi:MAG: hypothetical protein MZU91_13550 [Desulfosudis oleivorans]|nr:hypothetical protein [Desulfosudis oleivorans]
MEKRWEKSVHVPATANAAAGAAKKAGGSIRSSTTSPFASPANKPRKRARTADQPPQMVAAWPRPRPDEPYGDTAGCCFRAGFCPFKCKN